MSDKRWCLECGGEEGKCDCGAEFTTNMDRAYLIYMNRVKEQQKKDKEDDI